MLAHRAVAGRDGAWSAPTRNDRPQTLARRDMSSPGEGTAGTHGPRPHHCPVVRRLLGILLLLPLLLVPAPPAAAGALPVAPGPDGWPGGVYPVPGEVVTAFDPPEQPWLAGHRGVDLAAGTGDPVAAAAAGTVTYAATLAGRGVVVVTHGALRTTYEPVSAAVSVGQLVGAGQTIGHVAGGHASCAPRSCLHWGLRRGEEYLDPLRLPVVRAADTVRLVGAAEVGEARREALVRIAAARVAASGPVDDALGASGWLMPVPGPITSPFGMRVHPVTGAYKLHDGVDYGAACGTPIRAALPGRVTEVVHHPAYGWRARVDHGMVEGHRVVTSYNHARGYAVVPGQQVLRGQTLGTVGSTGWSTGCHLHLMAWVDGRLVDPAQLG